MSQLYFARYRSKLRYTHYLFRFPAKFHPPAVRCLIGRYTRSGDTILDPFCGSGTLLVESLLSSRNAVGFDIDPIATFVSRVKSRPVDPRHLESGLEQLMTAFAYVRRSEAEYDRLMFADISPRALGRCQRELTIPLIPSINHWFRRYVVVDLARMRNIILEEDLRPTVRDFFKLIYASVIRNVSNADPVPVSGLEVTSYMKRLDEKGRRIDPFDLFERRARRGIKGMEELWRSVGDAKIRVVRGDITAMKSYLGPMRADVVITSPPYNTAVDYHRRHMLEMYWLGFIRSNEERLALGPRYIGRTWVRREPRRLKIKLDSGYVDRLLAHAAMISVARERMLKHYCSSMYRALGQVADSLKPRKKAVFVVGNSKWNGSRVSATKLLIELAKSRFEVIERYSYPTENRYMSYARHNGADVNREHVVVLRKRRR